MNIYLTKNGQQLGPYTLAQVQDMVKAGTATLADMAWYEGLPDWVQLAQVPGMAAPGVAVMDVPQKRPVLVWIICLLFFTCVPFSLLSLATPTLMISNKMIPEAQKHFFESQGLFNYYLPTLINTGLILTWAIQLFRLKKNSLYFFVGSLGMGFLMLVVNVFNPEWLKIMNIFGWIGIGVVWLLNGLLLYYNWHLTRTNVLR